MNAVIIGRRRQGKSTLALWLGLSKHRTVVVWDPNAQFACGPILSEPQDIQYWVRERNSGIVIYRPDSTHLKEEFSALADELWPYGAYAVIVDEAAAIQRPQALHPSLERMIRQGPCEDAQNPEGEPCGISVIQTAHRAVDIHPDARSLWTDVFVFRTSMRADLDRLESDFGPDFAAAVENLSGRHHCVHWWLNMEGEPQWVVWTEPEVWFVDIKDARTRQRSGSGRTGSETGRSAACVA